MYVYLFLLYIDGKQTINKDDAHSNLNSEKKMI